MLRRNSNPVTLNESECYKSLIDDTRDKVFKLFNSNHIIDSDKDRIYNSLNNVRDNSYGKIINILFCIIMSHIYEMDSIVLVQLSIYMEMLK